MKAQNREDNIFSQVKAKVRVKMGELLKKHTTFRIGGRAQFFIQPYDKEALKEILIQARRHKLKVRIIGSGSNILAADNNMDCAVIKLSSAYFNKITVFKNSIKVGAGVALARLMQFAKENSLSGAEFLAGIPGTLGGALMMNAGVRNREIANLVDKIEAMDYNGRVKILEKKNIKFAYRSSNLGKYIILGAWLKLSKGSKDRISSSITEYLAIRRLTQEWGKPSAGCVFKNPPGYSAGKLIDLSGLKGKKIGRALVSLKHANFIINKGSAKSGDVLKLMDLIRKEVRNKYKIILEPEIKIWK